MYASAELRPSGISIHALREEGDAYCSKSVSSSFLFLSTPSARRATLGCLRCRQLCCISIHALREEGDMGNGIISHNFAISIHALREEGDTDGTGADRRPRYFYPRPPRGGRPEPTR